MASPCALALYDLENLLRRPQSLAHAKNCDDIIKIKILHDESTSAVLACPCKACKEGREKLATEDIDISAEKTKNIKRLLATCLIAERAWLIYSFLQSKIDDDKFDKWVSKTDLAKTTGLSLEDAGSLIRHKEYFFDGGRIPLLTYVRCVKDINGRPASSHEDRPGMGERNWLISELLALMKKLALAPEACARKLPTKPSMAKIKDITIRDSSARPIDRRIGAIVNSKGKEKEEEEEITVLQDHQREVAIINQQKERANTNLGNQEVCMQSLGYLIFDLICFFAGGGLYVQSLDKIRAGEVEWVKRTNWGLLVQDADLRDAFYIVWIMICPNPDFGFSKNDREGDNFAHVSKQFHLIWRNLDPDKEKNPERTSLLSKEPRLSETNSYDYEEIQPALFWWMLARYETENEGQTRCRLAVWKSKDKHNSSIRLDMYCIDTHPFKPWSHTTDTKDLRFIPLYAYGDQNGVTEFSAKFETNSRPRTKLSFHVFTFQTIEDVKVFQTAVTDRPIEKDILVDQISLRLKRHHLSLISKPETLNFSLGRLQLWRVCDDNELISIHEESKNAHKGARDYPLRVEIALFCKHQSGHRELIVIGVKSCLSLVDVSGPRNNPIFGLTIKPKDKMRAQAMEGKRLSIDSDPSAYPGMRLFQKKPFESNQEGERVICDYIELIFSTKIARDNLKQYLERRYNTSR